MLVLYVCLLMRYHYKVRSRPCMHAAPSSFEPALLCRAVASSTRVNMSCLARPVRPEMPMLNVGWSAGQVYARIRQRYVVQGETDTSDWCDAASTSTGSREVLATLPVLMLHDC